MFLTKSEAFEYKTIKRVLSFPVWHSNRDVLHVKKNRASMLKSPSILEKIHLDGINVFASNIIDIFLFTR